MGMFSYNYYKNLKDPEVYLAYPDKRIIGALQTYDRQTDIMANSADKSSFTIYSHKNNEPTPYYDEVELGKYVLFLGVNWFRIDDITIENQDTDNEYKEITAVALESELSQTYLTSFGSMGTDDDEQGGLDRYCLYSLTDQEHSILHIFLQTNPGWSIYYVDPEISKEYRNFQEDSVSSYSFLTDTVSDVYECIFIFDSFNKTISAYKLENLGKDTGITLQYRNLIKSIKKSSSEDDVKTVLTVCGGNDDRTNTTLGIIEVNIGGSNQIYDFSHYYPMMSDKLKNALIAYKKKCADNEAAYQEKLSGLKVKYEELGALQNHVPDDHDTTDWTQYGLAELNEKEAIYKTNMKLYMNDSDQTLYSKNQKLHAAVEAEIGVRKSQITAKENEINEYIKTINALIVNLRDFIGDNLYQQLGPFIREDTLTDDSFIVTNTMSDAEVLEMQKALLSHAYEELEKVSSPQYTLDVDLVNFTVNYDYKVFTDQLEMFNIVHISMDDPNEVMDVRLLKLHINWDDPSDFSATFSNKDTLSEKWNTFQTVKKQAEDTASKVDFSTGAWNKAASTSVTMDKYMNSVLDAAKQQIVSNENNEVIIDQTGILAKKWLPEKQSYDPAQLWITNNCIGITTDNWETIGMALGYVKVGNDYFYGVVADKIFGRLLMSKGLYVENPSGTYTINDLGLTAQNGSYKVGINPNTPSDIFTISIDNKKLLYVDADNKKLKFEGDIESKSGHIASYVISENDLTSGKVGISSTTTAGAISFWAGSTDRNNAAFRVDNNGKLVCSNAVITGGSLKVGDNFSVTSDGKLKAAGADVSGKITASSGKIAGWTINGNKLVGTSGNSYIEGGRIDIGDSFFSVDSDTISLGDFKVNYTTRGLLQSYDEVTGMSTGDLNHGEWLLWAGWEFGGLTDLPLFGVNTGQVHCNCDLYIKGQKVDLSAISGASKPGSWQHGWKRDDADIAYDWIQVTPSRFPGDGKQGVYDDRYYKAKYVWWNVNIHYSDGSDLGPDA